MDQSELTQSASERPDDIKAVPVRHPWRWVGAAVILVIVLLLALLITLMDLALNGILVKLIPTLFAR